MHHRMIEWLLKCYPSAWRSEYGAEMEDLLSRQPLSLPIICNVFWGALRERSRQPAHFTISAALVASGTFAVSVFYSPLLWRFVAAPVAQVLKDQSISPPMLVATSPLEQALVIWCGIPLLVTLFVAYPFSLLFACPKFEQPLKTVAACLATLYTVGTAGGIAAWHFGSFAWLLRILSTSPNTQVVSVSQCFGLLAASTLGPAVASQILLVLIGSWHSGSRRIFS